LGFLLSVVVVIRENVYVVVLVPPPFLVFRGRFGCSICRFIPSHFSRFVYRVGLDPGLSLCSQSLDGDGLFLWSSLGGGRVRLRDLHFLSLEIFFTGLHAAPSRK
jgi:hypothetical protein